MSEDGRSEALREFQLIEDKGEAESLFRESLRIRASAIIWTQKQDQVVRTTLDPRPGPNDTFGILTPDDFDSGRFSEQAKIEGNQSVFFSISNTRANIFFKTQFVSYTDRTMVFKNPLKIFKVQRRKNMRLRIRDGYVLRVEFDDPLTAGERMSKKAYDISAGGLSFLIPIAEVPLFAKELVLKTLSFTLHGRLIVTEGEVRHTMATRIADTHKVGVSFRNLRESDAQFIAKHIFDENLRAAARFI